MMDSPAVANRVLIIDDDDLVARMLATHVRSLGHEARVTSDPDEFLAQARSWKPTHVCVDLVMGDTDGIEVLGRLAEAGSDATVIITSGMGERVLEAARSFAAASGLAHGAVIPKPFTRKDVALALAGRTHRSNRDPSGPVELDDWDHARFESEIRAAITNGDIYVVYQPKVSCKNGHVTGFETLARWQHASLGLIPPIAFIPRAESVGLVELLTDNVFAQALSWFARAQLGTRPTLSVNISGSELGDRNRGSQLRNICVAAGVEPDRIILEVTETAAMADVVVSLEVLTRLRLAGFHLSIDDFGTGYAQMTQLSGLPFDELKIDGSFVRGASEHRSAELMVRSAVDLAAGLNMVTIAEGVEDAETFALMARLGCKQIQGYHIARPMPGPEVESWLTAYDPASVAP